MAYIQLEPRKRVLNIVPCWRYLLGLQTTPLNWLQSFIADSASRNGCRGSICVATISLLRNDRGCHCLLRSSGFMLRLANCCLGMDVSVDSEGRPLHGSVNLSQYVDGIALLWTHS
jgi:hypothetical protein